MTIKTEGDDLFADAPPSALVNAELYSGHVPSMYERFGKPVLDLMGAAIIFTLLLPLVACLAVAVYLTMGRPVLIRQSRVGRFGRPFTLYKVRTMVPDRRQEQIEFVGEDRRITHKSPDDPRVTQLGAFLRRWSLDELPQFVNVIRGDMSLVGPRPEMVEVAAKYEPWQHRRHAVKPGVTGVWQISHRNGKLLHECTEMELGYLDEISLGTDLRILVQTPLAALGMQRGF